MAHQKQGTPFIFNDSNDRIVGIRNPDGSIASIDNTILAEEYGAAGDGTTDDTYAIQSALNRASAVGGKVQLNAATYLISNTLAVPSNASLEGAGMGRTVLRCAGANYSHTGSGGKVSNAAITMMGVSYASVRHLTVDTATNSVQANGITIEPSGLAASIFTGFSSNCTIEECEVLGSNQGQYLIWNQGGADSLIAFNRIDGGATPLGTTAPASVVDQVGIEMYGGTRVKIIGNTVKNMLSIGITVGAPIGYGGTQMSCLDVVVSHNLITNVNDGFLIQGNSDTARSGTWKVRNLNLFGNSVTSFIRRAVHVYSNIAGSAGGGNKLESINIHDNNFVNTGTVKPGNTVTLFHAIHVELPANEDYYRGLRIAANNIQDVAVDTGATAFVVNLQYPQYLTFADNYIFNSTGQVLFAVGGNNVAISGNTFDTYTGKAINYQSMVGFKVNDNHFINGTYNNAVTMGSSGGASSYVEVVGNSFHTFNNYPQVRDNSSDHLRVAQNWILYADTSTGVLTFDIMTGGTNRNVGLASVATTTAVVAFAPGTSNTSYMGKVYLTQLTGTPTAASVTWSTTGFTITTATSGVSTWIWEIEG